MTRAAAVLLGAAVIAVILVVVWMYSSVQPSDTPPQRPQASDAAPGSKGAGTESAADSMPALRPAEAETAAADTGAAETPVANTVPGDLPLPSKVEKPSPMADYEIATIVVIDRQDEYYRGRIPYEEYAKEVQGQLKAQFGELSKDSVPSLLAYAREKEGLFWASGDLNNPDAYEHCYAAQAAVELALTLTPEDPELYGELAEIIEAGNPLDKVLLEEGKPRAANIAVVKQLIDVRSRQIELYEKSAAPWPSSSSGISPVFRSLLVLIELYSISGDSKAAASTYRKAELMAERGGWRNLAAQLGAQASVIESTPRQVFPVELLNLGARDRHSRSDVLAARAAADKVEGALAMARPWLRRTLFFEGPLHVRRVAEQRN